MTATYSLGEGNSLYAPQLESAYRQYGDYVYTLCLRLLANEKAAEDTTMDVFVRFNKELVGQSSELNTFVMLRKLAIRTVLARLRKRSRIISRILLKARGR